MAVYFIRAGEDGPVKIGWAKDPELRLRELQCGNWLPLSVLRVIPGEIRTEKLAHMVFKGQRLRGEWFSYSDAMLHWNPASELPCGSHPRSSGYRLPPLPASAHEGFVRELEAKAGGTSALARAFSVTRQTVHAWRRMGVNRRYRFMVKAVARQYGVPVPDGFAVLGPAQPIAGAA